MGLKDITDAMLERMDPQDRKALGKRGLTAAEAEQIRDTRDERELQGQFAGWLKRNAVHYIHANPTRKSTIRKGAPDFYCMREGRVMCIEFKLGRNELTDEQKLVLHELALLGIPAFVCYDYPGATDLVRKYFHLESP